MAQQTQAIAKITKAQQVLDDVQVDPRLLMAAKAIQLMSGQNDDGTPKLTADMALAAAMYQAGTGQMVGRDFYMTDREGKIEGYRGVARDAVDRGVGEVQVKYRPLTAQENELHEVRPGDYATVCEVYQLRAWRLAQRMGQPYEPIIGVGIVRKEEKLTRDGRPIPLKGGMTWSKKAHNRAYKDALRHTPGAPASADEVLEEAALAGVPMPPETARLDIEQAIEWVRLNQPELDDATEGEFELDPEPAKPPAPPTNGTTTTALPFKDQGTAVKWACEYTPYYRNKDGRADPAHAVGGINKICQELGCNDRDVECWGAAWVEHVKQRHADLEAAQESGDLFTTGRAGGVEQ